MASTDGKRTIVLRLNTEEEVLRFNELYQASGAGSISKFVRHQLFGKPFRVITVSRERGEIVDQMARTVVQIRRIGVLYNQAVKAINSYHTEVKAAHLVQKLADYTERIERCQQRIIELAERMNTMP